MTATQTLEISPVTTRVRHAEKYVLLVSPPSRMVNHYRPPLALMYISGFLKHKGIKSQIIDSVMEDKIVRDFSFLANRENYFSKIENDIIKKIQCIDTDVIGITCYTPEVDEVERLANRIKQVKPKAKEIRKRIIDQRCLCNHTCDMNINILFNWRMLLKALLFPLDKINKNTFQN